MISNQRTATVRVNSGPSPTPISSAGPARVPVWLFVAVYAIALACLGIAQLGTAEVEIAHDGAHYLQIARSLLRGEGFVTYTHWALNIPKGELPHPDVYRAPLYPMMVAAVAAVTKDLVSAGNWAAAIGGAFIPPLVLVFCVRRLGLAIRFGLLGALIALANHHLVIAGSRALTEAPYAAATLIALLFLTRSRPRPLLAGIAAGVAWLLRYQGVLLIPCALAALALDRGRPSAWMRRSLVFAAAFLGTITPWLVRNQVVAGSPFYTELKYHVVSTYDPERSFYQYFHGLTPPSEPLGYMIKRVDRTVLLFGHRLWRLVESFGRENAGNPLLLAFAILGVVHLSRGRFNGWRSQQRAGPDPVGRSLQVVGIFVALNVVAVSLTFAKHRHLTSCDPLVAALGAAGGLAALAWAHRIRRSSITVPVIAGLITLAILTEGVRSYRKISRTEPRGLQHAQAAARIIGDDIRPGQAIMASSPYFFAFALDRPAVSLPWADDEGLRGIALQHHVRYLCLTETEPWLVYPGSFMDTGVMPDWMYEAGKSPDGEVTVIGVDLERAVLAGGPDGGTARP